MRCSKGTPSCIFSACDSSDVSIGEGEGVGVKESADEGRISTPGFRRKEGAKDATVKRGMGQEGKKWLSSVP